MEFTKMEKFGVDHWSTLAYIETRCVDYEGILCAKHMRCNPGRHALKVHDGGWLDSYGTRTNDGILISGHDDWDCLNDLEHAGLVEIVSWVDNVVKLTDTGYVAAAKLRRFKAEGGQLGQFICTTAYLRYFTK